MLIVQICLLYLLPVALVIGVTPTTTEELDLSFFDDIPSSEPAVVEPTGELLSSLFGTARHNSRGSGASSPVPQAPTKWSAPAVLPSHPAEPPHYKQPVSSGPIASFPPTPYSSFLHPSSPQLTSNFVSPLFRPYVSAPSTIFQSPQQFISSMYRLPLPPASYSGISSSGGFHIPLSQAPETSVSRPTQLLPHSISPTTKTYFPPLSGHFPVPLASTPVDTYATSAPYSYSQSQTSPALLYSPSNGSPGHIVTTFVRSYTLPHHSPYSSPYAPFASAISPGYPFSHSFSSLGGIVSNPYIPSSPIAQSPSEYPSPSYVSSTSYASPKPSIPFYSTGNFVPSGSRSYPANPIFVSSAPTSPLKSDGSYPSFLTLPMHPSATNLVDSYPRYPMGFI